MQAWHDYYQMIGGAAATLLGLLFVSVTVRAEKIFGAGQEHSRRLAEQAFQNYLAVLMISLVALFSDLTIPTFGYIIMGATLAWGFWVVIRATFALSTPSVHEPRLRMFRRYIASLIGFAMLTYSGARMATGDGFPGNTLAVALLLLVVSATTVSWELLIAVAKEK